MNPTKKVPTFTYYAVGSLLDHKITGLPWPTKKELSKSDNTYAYHFTKFTLVSTMSTTRLNSATHSLLFHRLLLRSPVHCVCTESTKKHLELKLSNSLRTWDIFLSCKIQRILGRKYRSIFKTFSIFPEGLKSIHDSWKSIFRDSFFPSKVSHPIY